MIAIAYVSIGLFICLITGLITSDTVYKRNEDEIIGISFLVMLLWPVLIPPIFLGLGQHIRRKICDK